ncbi:MAG: aminotransferase class III-fold pyridoxal phosphate-dependent enzyme [Gallionella sp.]|nr:aminotransferase class III-fold pyridoxal phosphate-dependent enzyme [Gallionella sp.]
MPDPSRPTASHALLDRSHASVWHPCTQMKHHENFPLLPIARGSGVWLYGYDNRRYLDAVSSWWVNLFGHCNPRINAAITDQLGKLEHVMLAGFTHEPVVQLSERLRELAPAGLGHCFYASDGASATEIALKMSAHYWRNSGKPEKTQFISLANSYHGETLGALSVTDVALFRDAYGALIRQQATVPSPDWRNVAAGESAETFALRCADALERHLMQHYAQLAALIIEPLVQGAAGMAMYHPVYLRRARQLCDEYGVHLIADEIAVGMGRTGTMFACEQATEIPPSPPFAKGGADGGAPENTASPYFAKEEANNDALGMAASPPFTKGGLGGICPDFLLLSKGITGGYLPLSVVMTRDAIYQAFYADETARGFLHSHSYTGNPLACRAALATLDIFAQDDVIAANRDKAAYLNVIAQPLREHRAVRDWRNTGMIWAFEVDSPHRDFAQRCFALALENELLLRPIGKTVYFMPPYTIGEEEMDHLVKRTLHVIDQLK